MRLAMQPCLLCVGFSLASLAAFQTWALEAGSVLPSGHYVSHPPRYIPPSPPFPLPRELAQQEATAAALGQAQGAVAPLPPPVPVAPAP